jgi:hypothetical protein
MTKIVTCKCANSYQDATYGKQQRVANFCLKKGAQGPKQAHKCTVCGAFHL